MKPDIIGLQEISGWWWCPTNPNALKDYESLAFLLDNLAKSTGIRYRIATALVEFHFGQSDYGIVEGSSTAGGCQTMAGDAILYNPDTVEHITESGPYLKHDAGDTGIFLRRSLPCCDTKPDDNWICDRVDGVTDSEKCNSTRTGLAWSRGTGGGDGMLGRFRRKNGTREFHFYNFHWGFGAGHEPSKRDAIDFIGSMEQMFGSSERWIPPIATGDFNIPEPATPSQLWPDQFVLMSPDRGIDAVYLGNLIRFPAKYLGQQDGDGVGCSAVDGIAFSDHCFPWAKISVTE
ncbi:MAG: hypothetical protein ABIY55_25275 [Kofleriaceae bacterium]